ncbi:MAG: hypothetical protein ACI80I_001813 [Akkermansiaceae bacterium]|jgi:hypothetical protein
MAGQEIIAIVMPKLGMTMTEGKVVDWQVKAGDEIQEGDEVVGIETENHQFLRGTRRRHLSPPRRPRRRYAFGWAPDRHNCQGRHKRG